MEIIPGSILEAFGVEKLVAEAEDPDIALQGAMSTLSEHWMDTFLIGEIPHLQFHPHLLQSLPVNSTIRVSGSL